LLLPHQSGHWLPRSSLKLRHRPSFAFPSSSYKDPRRFTPPLGKQDVYFFWRKHPVRVNSVTKRIFSDVRLDAKGRFFKTRLSECSGLFPPPVVELYSSENEGRIRSIKPRNPFIVVEIYRLLVFFSRILYSFPSLRAHERKSAVCPRSAPDRSPFRRRASNDFLPVRRPAKRLRIPSLSSSDRPPLLIKSPVSIF